VVSALVLAPLIVPILITAIGIYFASTYVTMSTFWSLLLAHTALGLPFVVLVVLTNLKLLDPNFEKAARTLGASQWRAFRHITLPLISPSAVIGAIFAFQFSWDEVLVANFLSTPGEQTLPVVMWTEATQTIEPTVAAASSLLSAVTLALLIGYLVLQRRAVRQTLKLVEPTGGE
jgi:putative spermidine/putrescine transport system permease protein